MHATKTHLVPLAAIAMLLAACTGSTTPSTLTHAPHQSPPGYVTPSSSPQDGRSATVTLAFAGDMHFELQLAALLDHPRGALGPITRALGAADVTMVNLESAITERGTPEAKELEDPDNRYYFRTSPAALDVLAAAGVDVVTMANNHGADYGPVGLDDTLRAIRNSPVHVVGIGANRSAAFTPYRVTIRDTSFAFFGADASFREGSSSVWAAGPQTAGLAAAHPARPQELLDAVHAASRQDDVVVVYMHWGEELQGCPTTQQHITAQALARAGADIVVGSHAHVLLGAGWLDHTYVDYGLGNFLWYHNEEPETGVLRLTVRDGEVVGDSWVPARIHTHGRPHPVTGSARTAAIAHWRSLRACTGLALRSATSRWPAPDHHPPPTEFTATVRAIGPGLRDRMQYSHHPGCPVPLTELRYLEMTYLGFDGSTHTGEMVVHKTYAADIVDVFHQLYDAQWPIQQMRLVDAYRGDDERSMAANNTSGYNCRHVAGTHTWSAHAYGTAIDINPAQNPYLTTTAIHPPSAARYAHINRTPTARHLPPGTIQAGDIVVRAFNHIGWQWGGQWPNPKDFQHFSAPPLWAR
jgi:poly-gamma-glutamate capsule biosynthesis protein CapA/YwtB (metallophosphatase superfamily)